MPSGRPDAERRCARLRVHVDRAAVAVDHDLATVARPRPVPGPTSLVVKNESKMRSRISSAMPGPSSETSTARRRLARRLIVIVPLSPSASIALSSRFVQTWFSSEPRTTAPDDLVVVAHDPSIQRVLQPVAEHGRASLDPLRGRRARPARRGPCRRTLQPRRRGPTSAWSTPGSSAARPARSASRPPRRSRRRWRARRSAQLRPSQAPVDAGGDKRFGEPPRLRPPAPPGPRAPPPRRRRL